MKGDQELFERYHGALLGILSKEKKRTTARVYILGCGEYIKIGIAANVQSRILDLQIGNPMPISEVWSSVEMSRAEAMKIERLVHQALSDTRINGEWFKCSSERAKTAISELRQ